MLSLQKSSNLCQCRLMINTSLIIRTSKVSKRRKDEQKEKSPHLIHSSSSSKDNKMSINNALTFFDDHYLKTFGHNRWSSMRLALLSRTKHCALINNFSNVDEAKKLLQNEGCFNIKDHVMQKFSQLSTHQSLKQQTIDRIVYRNVIS